jgi:hypothetical protein
MPTARTLHRRAKALHLRLWSVRPGSRHWWRFGPYSIVDARTAGILARGLEREEVEACLDFWRELSLIRA